ADAGLPRAVGVSHADDIPTDCELVPWGWTPEVLEFAVRVGLDIEAPPLEAVRAVNSRQFARSQELAHGLALPGSGIAREWDQLVALLDASLSEQWVIKSEFSQAGRERFRVDL